MSITFQSISTTQDKLRLYQFRKQVFVDEENRWETETPYVTDLFDSIDETVNLAAFDGHEIAAAIRVTLESPAGFPSDAFWDSRDIRESLSGPCANFGWLCCAKKFRRTHGLIRTLVATGAERAIRMGAREFLSVIHPPVYEMLHHCFGVKRIGEAFRAGHMGVDMVPIHGRLDEILSRYEKRNGACVPEITSSQDPSHLDRYGYQGKYHFVEKALSRNLGILSAADQNRLLNMRVAIPGLGGVGGQHLITLARTGIGKFSLAESDAFEAVNFNRQYGARISNINRKKLSVMTEDALEVNPYLDLRTFPEGVTKENVDAFLDGVDLVADGMDFFNMEIRRLIFSRARAKGIPVITAGPLGFSSALLIFMPDRGMDFDTYLGIREEHSLEEQLIRFFVGLAPKASQAAYIDSQSISMSGQKGPSMGAACLMCSSVLSAEAVRILLKKPGIKAAPNFFQYDPFARKFHLGRLPMGNRHPVQLLKIRAVKKAMDQALPLSLPAEPDPLGDPAEVTAHLINAGCQAPSGDNCQPWTFTGRGNWIDLHLNPSADDSFFNFRQTASVIACGAAIENIFQTATRFGLLARPELMPMDENTDYLARICLSPERVTESPLTRFIWLRHTNRTAYAKTPLDDGDALRLTDSLKDFSGTRLMLIRDLHATKQVADLIYEGDLLRGQRRDLHEHLMKMIRFDREQALSTRDGFPLRNLNAGSAGEAFLKVARPWGIMKTFNRMGMGTMVAKTAGRWARQASALGLITVRGKDRSALLKGGMAMERIWLTATSLGLSFQPLTPLTLFRARWDAGQLDDFTPPQQNLLARIWPVFDELFPVEGDETRIMLFRIGYGRPMSCRTLRRYQGEAHTINRATQA